MVSSKQSKIFNFCLFLTPALLLYTLFFIIPFFQGIQYSFTDWNGIVPEIPFNMTATEFKGVLGKLSRFKDAEYLKKYYIADESGEYYSLTNWVRENGKERQLTVGEKKKIKAILKSAGISSIKFIGLANYKEIFRSDMRFLPRLEKSFLFKEYDDLPLSIDSKTFNSKLLNHLSNKEDRAFLLSRYTFNKDFSTFNLKENLNEEEINKLKTILAGNMYENILIWGVLGFTLFFAFFNVVFANFLALGLAIALDNKLKTRNILRSIFFLPNVLSLIIVAFIWSFVFRLILPAVTGITMWFGTEMAPYSVVIVSVWQSCGYLMVIYLAGLQAIPQEILEVAKVDGAPWWQRFRHITFPLLLPAVTICLFYSLANSLKTFEVAMALTGGGPGYVTTPIVLDIYNNAFLQNQYGYGTAKAVLLCLIIMIITGTQLFFMKKREVEL